MSKNDVDKMNDNVGEYFLLPFNLDELVKPMHDIAEQSLDSLKLPAEIFVSAIKAAYTTTTLPYLLARSRAFALYFQRIHMSERIKDVTFEDTQDVSENKYDEEREKVVVTRANKIFRKFIKSDEGVDACGNDISRFLIELLNEEDISKASNELLYQGVISLWSAFEVMVRDVLTAMLNESPQLSERLLSDVSTKKYFDMPKISVHELSTIDYDLSNKMGSILFGSRDFSDIRAIKAATIAIIGEAKIAEVLNNDSLWRLNQDRHLIVHRRGIVDAKYLKGIKSQYKIGQSIVVSPTELEEYFKVIINCGMNIFSCLEKAE